MAPLLEPTAAVRLQRLSRNRHGRRADAPLPRNEPVRHVENYAGFAPPADESPTFACASGRDALPRRDARHFARAVDIDRFEIGWRHNFDVLHIG
jgi:hypothetical protein